MSHKKDTEEGNIVTFIADPFGISTIEVTEAQNESEFENEFQDPEAIQEETEEEIEDQFEKIAQAMAEQEPTVAEVTEEDPADILEAQIAEDQALIQALESAQALADREKLEPSPVELRLDAEEIQSCLEALLFISDRPISLKKFGEMLGSHFSASFIETALKSMQERYLAVYHGFELVEIAGGYQFRTKPGRADLAKRLAKVQTHRLSSGGMETLAIIAYKQPIMKEEVDKIRGVDSSYFVRGLLEKKLIKISGRSELPGRPMLYSTTDEFMEVFGLKDLNSLPSLRELEQMVPTSQSANPADEDPRIRDLRKMVGAMTADRTSALHYNPEEDDKILKEIRQRVTAIPTSTPYLDELKAAEILATQAQKQQILDEKRALEPEVAPEPVPEA